MAFLDRGQEELERLELRLPFVRATEMRSQCGPVGLLGGSTPRPNRPHRQADDFGQIKGERGPSTRISARPIGKDKSGSKLCDGRCPGGLAVYDPGLSSRVLGFEFRPGRSYEGLRWPGIRTRFRQEAALGI